MLNNTTLLLNTLFKNVNINFGMALVDPKEGRDIITKGHFKTLKPKTILGNVFFSYQNDSDIEDETVLEIVKSVFNRLLKRDYTKTTEDMVFVEDLLTITYNMERFLILLNKGYGQIDIGEFLDVLEHVCMHSKELSYADNPLMLLNEFFENDITFKGFEKPLKELGKVRYPILYCDVEYSERFNMTMQEANKFVMAIIKWGQTHMTPKKKDKFNELIQQGYKTVSVEEFENLNSCITRHQS